MQGIAHAGPWAVVVERPPSGSIHWSLLHLVRTPDHDFRHHQRDEYVAVL